MIDPLAPAGDGHTELADEDSHDLIPTWIATRGDLNDAEQSNIAVALLRKPPSSRKLLDDKYLRGLHRAMFSEVWTWAGKYRSLETNLGIAPENISVAVRNLVSDARTWIENQTYEFDEVAVRFHHRLVAIHPFPNGNGRHGRIAADYLAQALDRPAFTWGAGIDTTTEELRSTYQDALRHADTGDIADLIVFARS